MQIAELNVFFSNSAAAGPQKGQAGVLWVLLKGHKRYKYKSPLLWSTPFFPLENIKSFWPNLFQHSPRAQRARWTVHAFLSGLLFSALLQDVFSLWYGKKRSHCPQINYKISQHILLIPFLFFFYVSFFIYIHFLTHLFCVLLFFSNVHATYVHWGSERQMHYTNYTLIWKDSFVTFAILYLILCS